MGQFLKVTYPSSTSFPIEGNSYEVDPTTTCLRLGHASSPLWSAASASRARNPFVRTMVILSVTEAIFEIQS